jgi:hypothetical protein
VGLAQVQAATEIPAVQVVVVVEDQTPAVRVLPVKVMPVATLQPFQVVVVVARGLLVVAVAVQRAATVAQAYQILLQARRSLMRAAVLVGVGYLLEQAVQAVAVMHRQVLAQRVRQTLAAAAAQEVL